MSVVLGSLFFHREWLYMRKRVRLNMAFSNLLNEKTLDSPKKLIDGPGFCPRNSSRCPPGIDPGFRQKIEKSRAMI